MDNLIKSKNKQLIKLWEDKKNSFKDVIPNFLIPAPFPKIQNAKRDLLIIGLNPSFNTDYWYKIFKVKKDHINKLIEDVDENLDKDEKKSKKKNIITSFFKYQSVDHFNNNLKYI